MTPGRCARRRALVTGGASGIGRAIAERLEREGAAVAVLEREGGPVTADVREETQVARAVATAAELLGGPPDILVNSAGIYRIAPLLGIESDEWDEVLDTNLRGSFFVAREVAKTLIAARSAGSIVNISSIAGLVSDAVEPTAHYSASKAGVLSLTKQMAVEWAPYGIRVNAVCPGAIDTPMLRLMDDPEVGQRWIDSEVPLKRLGQPEEVAALIAFLASDEASYITGAAVTVDGGATL